MKSSAPAENEVEFVLNASLSGRVAPTAGLKLTNGLTAIVASFAMTTPIKS